LHRVADQTFHGTEPSIQSAIASGLPKQAGFATETGKFSAGVAQGIAMDVEFQV